MSKQHVSTTIKGDGASVVQRIRGMPVMSKVHVSTTINGDGASRRSSSASGECQS